MLGSLLSLLALVGAVTFGGTKKRGVTNRRVVLTTMVGPASYTNTGTWATSGELLSAGDLNALMPELAPFPATPTAADYAKIELFEFEPRSDAANPNFPVLDRATGRIHFYVGAGSVEVANGVNLSGLTFIIQITYMVRPTDSL